MTLWESFHGPNAGYVLELFERYLADPESVDPSTRAQFEVWRPDGDGARPIARTATMPEHVTVGEPLLAEQVRRVVNLAEGIRDFGHLGAQLDPLGSAPPGDPALELSTYGLDEQILRQLPGRIISGQGSQNGQSAFGVIAQLRKVYCSTTGYHFDFIQQPGERAWLREAAESGRFQPPEAFVDEVGLLRRLIEVETFERFLHRRFPGKTRFSVEGLDVLIPMLDQLIGDCDKAEAAYTILGMAHRGRLNVLAHVLHKPYEQILAEFKDPDASYFMRELGWDWSGDVKYHTGKDRVVQEVGEALTVILVPNPSHLEHVNPVVMGMARAAGSEVSGPGAPTFYPERVLSILIHGDAAFPGLGIVPETLNLSRLPGYGCGGTIHIVANNQIGYTTLPQHGRSTRYASDLAKGFNMPVIHVNADDPLACIAAARIAFSYRATFRKDFVIDLIGYRRHGHNEGDEPNFTQPVLYDQIDHHPSVGELWARRLVDNGLIATEYAEGLTASHMEQLQGLLADLRPEEDFPAPQLEPPPRGMAKRTVTTLPVETLQEMNQALLNRPEGFRLHPKIARVMEQRLQMLADADARSVDWSAAESLALASVLAEGIPVRLTGEDVERGTFSHRHAVWHDTETGAQYVPLQALPQARASFEVHNSPLSESGVLGFEYGYNVFEPGRLVIWEAQFGDFINGGQAIVDEFIVSGRAKWEQTPSLVLLLPHGYEGQGPDHSTGRLERFLQLAAETNMRIANPTTPANYYHLIRRQALLLRSDPLPLIVMSPKSLLRHPLAMSSMQELASGSWQRTIDDPDVDPAQVRRLIWCSGKVYYDLIRSAERPQSPAVAIARLEQLYPFPYEDVQAVLERYPHLEEVVWLQEEPQNMGAWESVDDCLIELLGTSVRLSYQGRPRRASPAEGSMTWHIATQQALVQRAFAGLGG